VKAAARLTDRTSHGTPLLPGPGSPNVIIESLPAWRGIPAAAAKVLQAAQSVANAAMEAAEAVSKAARPTPYGPAAYLAEQAIKSTLSVSMGSLVSALGAASDIHFCPVPVPVPPHGPGVVIDGSPTVFINHMHACRVGDIVLEALGGPDPIAMGARSVFIGDGGRAGGIGRLSFSAIAAAFVEYIEDASETAATGAKSFLRETTDALGEFAAGVGDFFSDAADDALDGITSAYNWVADGVQDTYEGAVNYVEGKYRDFKHIHYVDRINRNGKHPQNLRDILPLVNNKSLPPDERWYEVTELREKAYHDNGIGKAEFKFVRADGREAVFDGDTWEMVTDERYIATYNYAPLMPKQYYEDKYGPGEAAEEARSKAFWDHSTADVAPYWLLGNTPTDSTSGLNRAIPAQERQRQLDNFVKGVTDAIPNVDDLI
jgi:uncharacterized Zn-binding protein involved in type VI secretion